MSFNYSQTSISNLALGRIGAREITSVNENSPNAKKILAVWDAIFLEVLSERDWKFAKVRTQLQRLQDPQTNLPYVPLIYGWLAAWVLPSDFLRFVRPRKRQDPGCFWYNWGTAPGWYFFANPPFWPPGFDWIVEAVTVSNQPNNPQTPIYAQCVLTNYTGCNLSTQQIGGQTVTVPAAINYIRQITDYTQLLPGFVNCLANRLAAEIAVNVTEDKQKYVGLMQAYHDSLNSAEAQNETSDYQLYETGSETWVRAGRSASWGVGNIWGGWPQQGGGG